MTAAGPALKALSPTWFRVLADLSYVACLWCFICLDRRWANIAIIFMTSVAAVKLVRDRPGFRDSLPGRNLILAWLLWIAAATVSLFFALNIDYSRQNYRHDVLAAAAVFFASAVLLEDRRRLKLIWASFLGCIVVLAASGIYQYHLWAGATGAGLAEAFAKVRVDGLAPHVHGYIFRIFISFPFWALFLGLAGSRGERLVIGAGLGLAFLGWLLGFGRVQLMLLPLMAALFPLLARVPLRYINAALLAAFTVSAAAVVYLTCTDYFFADSNIGPRQFMWRVSGNYLLEHPFRGIGFGNVSYEFLDGTGYLAGTNPQHLPMLGKGGHHPHNYFLNIWLTTGLQGLLAVLYLGFSLYATVAPFGGRDAGGDEFTRLWCRAFLIALIMSVPVNLSDVLLTENSLKLLLLLAGTTVGAVRLLKKMESSSTAGADSPARSRR